MAEQFFNSSGQQIAVEDADGKRFPVKATFDQTTPGTTNGVAPDSVVDGASQSGSVTSAATIATLALAGFRGASVVWTSTGVGTALVEVSFDNQGSWVTANGYLETNNPGSNVGGTSNPVAFGTNSPIYYPVTATHIRARISAYTSGTFAATITGKRTPPPVLNFFAANNTSNQVPVATVPNSTAAYAIAPAANSALASSKVLKASAGNLYGLNLGSTTVAGYFMLFNATSLPGDGTVTPVKQWAVTAGQSLELQFNPPLRLGTGITVAFSSNTTTPYTLAASATAFIDGEFV